MRVRRSDRGSARGTRTQPERRAGRISQDLRAERDPRTGSARATRINWQLQAPVAVATVATLQSSTPLVEEVMADVTRSDKVRAAEFVDADLHGARFVRADLSGVVMRAVDVTGADIDAPWLLDGGAPYTSTAWTWLPSLRPNSTAAFLAARIGAPAMRWPARGSGSAERTWAATLERTAGMPAGTVDVQVDGEWSFAQTLRHLVMATNTWLGRAILEIEQPFHPLGQPNFEYETDGNDMSDFATITPSYAEVLEARAGRVAMVRDFLATLTEDDMTTTRKNPHDPAYPETILSCLHTILEEEWEHHRFAVRDLDTIESTFDA